METATRVPKRSLERLEAGAYDGIPDGFARGFVRTVAGAIGLDPEATVARMLAEPEWVGDRKRPAWGAMLWIGAGVMIVASLLLIMVGGIRTSPSGLSTLAPQAKILRRFDAVRALAEELGVSPNVALQEEPAGLAHEAPALADEPPEAASIEPAEPSVELPPLPPRARAPPEELVEVPEEGPHPAEMPRVAP